MSKSLIYNENNLPLPIKKGKTTFKDYSNTKINNIQILYPISKNKDGKYEYLAKCFCGNYFKVLPYRLKNGNTKSCGCLFNQKIIEFNTKIKRKEEIIGKKFGYLEVLEFDDFKQGKKYRKGYYKCLCHNCGQIKSFCGIDLRQEKIKSCGCIKSFKEKEIENILIKNKINYKKEYSFLDLYDKNPSYPLRFDFAIFNNNNNLYCLIEYQGEQHYNKNNGYYSLSIEKHDKMKKEYCKNKSIKLVELNKNSNIEEEILYIVEVIKP